MARIPKRLAGPGQLTNVAVTKYTCPALTKTVIRHVHVSNPSGAPVTFTMSIGADAPGARVFDALSIAAGSVLDHFCYYIVDVAEVVQALAGTTLTINFTMDGDEIVLG